MSVSDLHSATVGSRVGQAEPNKRVVGRASGQPGSFDGGVPGTQKSNIDEPADDARDSGQH